MLEHKRIQSLNDYFLDLNSRREKGVYFYRINGYSDEIQQFIEKYYEVARREGVVLEGKIPNPTDANLAYYNEIMGMEFKMELDFISSGLKKWLPRMNDYQRQSVASSIYYSLNSMRKSGKNDNILKNAYIKFMCWLYYKFERIINQLGENIVPKILYEGEISNYELMLISILSGAGCDVVMIQHNGDEAYKRLDANSSLSILLEMQGMQSFPSDFSIKKIREDIQTRANNERLYGSMPSYINCTNAWIKGKGLEDFLSSVTTRGTDKRFYYNCFCRINGVEDKLTYVNELFNFQQELKGNNRKLVIVSGSIKKPTPDEISQIKHSNYARQDQMIMDLGSNIQYTASIELQKIMHKAFVDVLLDEAKLLDNNFNKLTSRAVYLLCWIKRYQSQIFGNWKYPDIGCFIYLGGCKNDNEAMFIKFLAKLPVDVLVLCPDLNTKCQLNDKQLFEVNNLNSMVVEKFPEDNSQVRIGTVAYHAERELDTLMYQDSGLYRNKQFAKANSVSLQTMYEEIKLLWNEELKYRPNFSTTDEVVNIPVIFTKVSGIKDGDVAKYWSSIKDLITDDTIFIDRAPYIDSAITNPMKAYSTEFYKNGKVRRNTIKSHKEYKYSFLREEIQDFILDKLQVLIDSKTIKGTFENGTEYTIVATILNLNTELVRLIQKFDFTKKNPKLIYVNTKESIISLEDSIVVAFLNLIGFDVIFFVPTGYQNIEKYFNHKVMEEHQIGEYIYDLEVPNMKNIPLSSSRQSWRDKIFKRGR